MKKQLLFFISLILIISRSYATHNRAGEITYQYISGFTYLITVTTYTKESSVEADRCILTVYFGDGDSSNSTQFIRNNGSTSPSCIGTPPNQICNGNCPYYGESLGNDVKKNVYQGYHRYPGPGTYIISMGDIYRNAGICNIPNSVNVEFYIQSELVIDPLLGPCSSPVLLNPPIDEACLGKCFTHNPGAYDADDDSLAYSLTSCYANGLPITGWSWPQEMSDTSINVLNGDLKWCVPPVICVYNIAIIIKFYRRLPGNSKRYFIGSIERDMQITVHDCPTNPPMITTNLNDTCVVAGSNVNLKVTASTSAGYLVSLTATGGALESTPAATFPSPDSALNSVTGTFAWTPNCTDVQLLPYLVTFKATDNSLDTTADYASMFVRVIAPPPVNLTATPSGSSIVVHWNASLCSSTIGGNPLVSYLVYRKNSCSPFVPDNCQTGVPSSSGYTLIGTTSSSVTTFTDDDDGQGLSYGINYSYLVVATYNDGSQSYASTNVCAKLVRDVPVITNVSVVSTGTNDSIWIHWVPPIGDPSNLDTNINPPPYKVVLLQAKGFDPTASSFTPLTTYTYSAFSKMVDTGFVSTGLNTVGSAYTYRVDFYYNDSSFLGSTNNTSSVYLSTSPGNKQLTLSWQEQVPWTNYKYFIYKETTPTSNIFKLIDSTTTATYTDTGLVNRRTYCYKVETVGAFSDTTIIHPLYNYSQIQCAVPVDTIPPCQPAITSVTNDCDTAGVTIMWRNPNTYCSDEAATYNIYFAPTDKAQLLLVHSINSLSDTTYTYHYFYDDTIPSAAGCFAVTTIDSSGYESRIVTKQCTDNCPVYELPNVFTPNGDGINDFFEPLIPYRYVLDISINIYNRWGNKLFETTNPYILWDGKDMVTKKSCPDGVYYYICTVNEIRLSGIVPHTLKGFTQLITGTDAVVK